MIESPGYVAISNPRYLLTPVVAAFSTSLGVGGVADVPGVAGVSGVPGVAGVSDISQNSS
jgi:hypothetical protein